MDITSEAAQPQRNALGWFQRAGPVVQVLYSLLLASVMAGGWVWTLLCRVRDLEYGARQREASIVALASRQSEHSDILAWDRLRVERLETIVAQHSDLLKSLVAQNESQNQVISDLRASMGRIETDVRWMRKRLER